MTDQEIIDNGGQPRKGFGAADKENDNLSQTSFLSEEQSKSHLK